MLGVISNIAQNNSPVYVLYMKSYRTAMWPN